MLSEQWGCKKNHERRFAHCANSVVYEIPLPCGEVYIGQAGRFLNDRLGRHTKNLTYTDGSHLVDHFMVCSNCETRFQYARLLGRSKKKKTAREALGAFLFCGN